MDTFTLPVRVCLVGSDLVWAFLVLGFSHLIWMWPSCYCLRALLVVLPFGNVGLDGPDPILGLDRLCLLGPDPFLGLVSFICYGLLPTVYGDAFWALILVAGPYGSGMISLSHFGVMAPV